MWKVFRAVCDEFFAKKKAYYDSLEDRQKENMAQKEAIINKLKGFKATGEAEKDMEALRKLTFDYQNSGMVGLEEELRIRGNLQPFYKVL